jgi:outer membrane protein
VRNLAAITYTTENIYISLSTINSKFMKSAILSIILLFSVTFNAFQQNAWTLEQCINHALQNNLQIKIQEINIQYYKNTYRQSILNVLPNLNGNGNYSINSGRALDETTYQFTNQKIKTFNGGISSSVTLFNGLQKVNTIIQNKYKVLSGIEEVEKFKNDISLNLALAYLQLILNRELAENSSNQLTVSKLQLTRTKQLMDAGSIPQSKYLEVQAQVANEELDSVNAQNQVDIALLNLKQMLDLDTVKNFDIIKPDFTNYPIADIVSSIDDIYKQAESNLPQIKQAEYSLKSSKKGLDIARGGRSFNLSLSYSYGTAFTDPRMHEIGRDPVTDMPIYGNYSNSDQLKDNKSSTISLRLAVPIFNGWMTNTSISNAKLDVMNSEYQLEVSKKQLYKDIQQAQTDALAAFKRYNASENAARSSEESFRSISQKFELGIVNFVDYSTSKSQLAEAQSTMLQAKYSYIFKTKVLEFYKNGQIKL